MTVSGPIGEHHQVACSSATNRLECTQAAGQCGENMDQSFPHECERVPQPGRLAVIAPAAARGRIRNPNVFRT